MRSELRRRLVVARKARDAVAVAALSSALAAIDNAEAVPADDRPAPHTVGGEHVAGTVDPAAAEVERRQLTAADLRALVTAEVTERSSAAGDYERAGRPDRAERLRAEAAVLRRFLAESS